LPSRYNAKQIYELVSRISETNRPLAQEYLTAKQGGGLKTSSLVNCARGLFDLDRLTLGKPYRELAPHDVSKALAVYRIGLSERSAKNLVVRLHFRLQLAKGA
jgi:hypothetical protein